MPSSPSVSSAAATAPSAKPLAGEGLVGEGQLVNRRLELGGVGSGHLSDALRAYLRLFAQCGLDDARHALGGSAGGVELVDVVDLLHMGCVAVAAQYLAGALHCCEEGVDPDREVGRPYQWGAVLAELREHFVLYVVPAGGPDHGGPELAGDLGVVGPEGVGCREIYAHALRGQFVGHRAHVVGSAGEFDAAPEEHGFDHVAHLPVSANYNFHIS